MRLRDFQPAEPMTVRACGRQGPGASSEVEGQVFLFVPSYSFAPAFRRTKSTVIVKRQSKTSAIPNPSGSARPLFFRNAGSFDRPLIRIPHRSTPCALPPSLLFTGHRPRVTVTFIFPLFVFMVLQIPFPPTPFFAHPYKTPGVLPPSVLFQDFFHFRVLPASVVSPFFSSTCGLLRFVKKVNSFAIEQIPALFAKHRGWSTSRRCDLSPAPVTTNPILFAICFYGFTLGSE